MPDLPISYPVFMLIFLAAGMVKGVSGMGLPTIAMGLLGSTMPPTVAAALLVIPSFVTNVWQLLSGRALSRLFRRFWPMLACIVIGTVSGAALLVHLHPSWTRLGLGLSLMVYAGYALLTPSLSIPRQMERWASPLVGGLTGLVTGATGVFVVPAVPYLQSLRLEKEELVQALGLSFTVSTVALALGLSVNGAFHADQWQSSALAVLPALAGMWLGQKVRAYISPARFRQGFLIFLILLGLELAWRPFQDVILTRL